MGKDQADQRVQPQSGRALDCFLEQPARNAAASKLVADINAHLRGPAISRTRDEFFETEPARDLIIHFRDPQWIVIRSVFAKPGNATLHRNRFELGRNHACRQSCVVDFDDGWKIGLDRVPDSHFLPRRSPTANKLPDNSGKLDATERWRSGKTHSRRSVEKLRLWSRRFETVR